MFKSPKGYFSSDLAIVSTASTLIRPRQRHRARRPSVVAIRRRGAERKKVIKSALPPSRLAAPSNITAIKSDERRRHCRLHRHGADAEAVLKVLDSRLFCRRRASSSACLADRRRSSGADP
jgi:hypothetical protein